jgi:hypothetical protein
MLSQITGARFLTELRGIGSMHDVMRERIWRKLQVLPEAQLYQVLDYIEFLESKYAPGRAAQPDGLQRFAERLEDSMRLRSVAPKVISGTVGLMGTASRVLRTVSDAGRDILGGGPPPERAPRPERPPDSATAPPERRVLPRSSDPAARPAEQP